MPTYDKWEQTSKIIQKVKKYSEINCETCEWKKCAIGNSYNLSCFTEKQLLKIYNSIWKNPLPSKYNKKYLVEYIEKQFPKCKKNHICWLKNKTIKQLFQKEQIFLPPGPETKNEWLSNIDILNVFKQVEKVRPKFILYDCISIDFAKYKNHYQINHIKFDNLFKHNIYKIGIIINLDFHHGSGTHWVALFLNLKKGKIFYFDWTGAECPDEILMFVKKVIKWFDEKHISYEFKENKYSHQQKGSECGIYVINFILRMIENKNFD